jgi:hypothetical protein
MHDANFHKAPLLENIEKVLSSQFIIPLDSLSRKIFLLYKKASIVHWKHSILNDIQSCDKDHRNHNLYQKIELSSLSAAASKLEPVFKLLNHIGRRLSAYTSELFLAINRPFEPLGEAV